MEDVRSKLRKLDDCTLNAGDLETAERELGETKAIKEKCLMELKTALTEIENFEPRTDDNFLLWFLRIAKFDTVNALKRIQKYYNMRKQYPEIFKDWHPSALKDILNPNKTHFLMPYRNHDSSFVYIVRKGLNDPTYGKMTECLRLETLLLHLIFDNPLNQLHGMTCVLDCRGIDLRFIQLAFPSTLSRMINVTVGSVPMRLKMIYLVNVSAIANLVYSMAAPLLPKKLRDRFFFHRSGNDWSKMHSLVSPEALPEEYGGKLGPLDSVYTTNLLLQKDEFFKEQQQYGFI